MCITEMLSRFTMDTCMSGTNNTISQGNEILSRYNE